MEDLISLCQLIDTQRVDQIDIFDKKKHKGKTWKLYDSIIKGEITDDKEGMAMLYGESGSKHDYNRLKARLEGKLLNNLFFLDFKKTGHSELFKEKYKVAKNTHLVNILEERNEVQNAYLLSKKTYSRSVKFDLTEYSLLLARYIFRFHSLLSPNKRKK